MFKEFVNFIEKIHFSELVNMTALRKLVKIYNETEEVTKFIEKVLYNYEPKVDRIIAKYTDNRIDEMFGKSENPNRPLFSKQTAKKIMNHMDEKVIAD